jgi:hypothetical protein
MSDKAGRTFRFPPVIGATVASPLLFVGINPRASDSNRHLHEALMRDFATFRALAGNRCRDRHYIGPRGLERHYSAHVQIAERIFPRQPFDEVAAVTELFFCASQSSQGLREPPSPCADKYFERVLGAIRPKIIFAVGRPVEENLASRLFCEGGKEFVKWGQSERALMLAIPHPNSRGEKRSKWRTAADAAKAYLEAPIYSQHVIREEA